MKIIWKGMVNAESRIGFVRISSSPTPPSPRGRLGYSPQHPSLEYSGSPDRPVFGLGRARRYFPEGEVEIPAAPFQLEKRRQYPETNWWVPYWNYEQYFTAGGYPQDSGKDSQ